jgi:hypothetical protein
VWLTSKQRQERTRRAKAEMRTPGNYVTAVVLGALAEGEATSLDPTRCAANAPA